MQSRVVLVSDDANFFEYFSQFLNLRKFDELFKYKYDDLPDKLSYLDNSLFIINGESSQEYVLQLLDLISNSVVIVFSYNDEPAFKSQCYDAGCYSFLTMLMTDNEISSVLSSALKYLSNLSKSDMYRKILIDKKVILPNNEVYTDYNFILDSELQKINSMSSQAVLMAISPDDKSKFFIPQNQLETIILSSIRQNDILMNYAPNKYFLLLKDVTIDVAEKLWVKIKNKLNSNIYAGFSSVYNKNREQLVNDVLNKLHDAINKSFLNNSTKTNINKNFKTYRAEYNKNMENIITPVFYQIKQKYEERLFGMSIKDKINNGGGIFVINSKYSEGIFNITSPGCTKINVDITYNLKKDSAKNSASAKKRITLEPEELEAGIVEDILEQFVIEFKNEVENEYS